MNILIDTNIALYLLGGDETNVTEYARWSGGSSFFDDAPEKKRKAQDLLLKAAEAGQVLLSTQVLQEFYSDPKSIVDCRLG